MDKSNFCNLIIIKVYVILSITKTNIAKIRAVIPKILKLLTKSMQIYIWLKRFKLFENNFLVKNDFNFVSKLL